MNKKRLYSMILLMVLALSLIPSVTVGAASRQTAYAVYGTPVIDGEIDEVWDKANYYVVTHCSQTGEESYKGWFKVLWDEDNIYVLAKEYSTQLSDRHSDAWYHDSFDVYVDEDMGRTSPYSYDDYQLRSNFNALVTGNNYPDFNKVQAASKPFDGGFVGEMAFPLVTKKNSEGLEVGFEVLMTASESVGIEMRVYLWNCRENWLYNDTNCYGNLKLVKYADVSGFDEPEFNAPTPLAGYSEVTEAAVLEKVTGVTTSFDSTVYSDTTVLLSDEYPCMAIDELATIIGASATADTITKDGKWVKFTEGSLLAQDAKGHLMLDRAPVNFEGKLFVPVSYVMPSYSYTMHYNRFDKIMTLKTGTDYPQEPQIVVYAKDYGAVGDGVTKDGQAILHAINAAINSGVPAKVELEAGKTYLIEHRPDNYAYIVLKNVSNLTIDGNGSELLFETPTNNLIYMENCANVKLMNIDVDYKELTFTQGRSTAIDSVNRTFRIEIDEGFPLPASDEWVKYYYPDAGQGGWWFTQIMDPVEPRLKYGVTHYDIFIDSIKHIQGREYEVTVKNGYQSRLAEANVGDRFVINTRLSSYDIGTRGNGIYYMGMIEIIKSGDIYVKDVNVYASPWHGVNAGLCWGKINLDGYGMKTKDGRLMSANSDGIHYWRCREGLILENSVMMNNLDDHVNTKGESSYINRKIDDYTYDLDWDQLYQRGDELIFIDQVNNNPIGRAFVKSVQQVSSSSYIVTVDRPIDNIITLQDETDKWSTTAVTNLNCTAQGSVYRNTLFTYSRRYGVLSRSRNSIFEDNRVIENGGSGLRASDEKRTSRWESGYPSCFTMRNNYIDAPDCLPPDYPVLVEANRATAGSKASIVGFLMENNTIDTNVVNSAIYIKFVKGLYMINNTIRSTEPLESWVNPIVIENSRVDLIDGINFDYKQNVDAVVTISGSEVDEKNIKNITINQGNTAKPYKILSVD